MIDDGDPSADENGNRERTKYPRKGRGPEHYGDTKMSEESKS